MNGFVKFVALGFLTGMLAACSVTSNVVPEEAYSVDATLGANTKTGEKLLALPVSKELVPIAVYEFNDQTGQNKPAAVPQYSRAVTQGGLAILKKALLDAGNYGWFRVLERGGLQNLLQERKIIRSMRDEYLGPQGQKLPSLGPLLYAGLLLEGGIVAYESNVLTGGAGARYLGIGGSTTYSRDMVTIYLRVVSVKSGEVLLSVNSSKTIYSQDLSGGIFKFVSYDKLLESEAGYTFNEPPQLAVRQAIEFGVLAMVMEGYKKGLWEFKDAPAGKAAYGEFLAAVAPAQDDEEKDERKMLAAKVEDKKRDEVQELAAALPKEEAPVVPVRRTEPAKAIVPLPRPRDSRSWYVAFGSRPTLDYGSMSILGALRSAGYPVTVQNSEGARTRSYQMVVGPYGDREEAQKMREHIISNYPHLFTTIPFPIVNYVNSAGVSKL